MRKLIMCSVYVSYFGVPTFYKSCKVNISHVYLYCDD